MTLDIMLVFMDESKLLKVQTFHLMTGLKTQTKKHITAVDTNGNIYLER